MPSRYQPASSKKRARKPAKGAKDGVYARNDGKTPGERMEGYGREQRHPSGREWKRIVASVVAYYNGICHLCGHPGARQADHLVQYAEGGDDSIANLRPAHGTANTQRNPCPVCGLNCNNVRGALSVEAGRAKIARRLRNAPVAQDGEREW